MSVRAAAVVAVLAVAATAQAHDLKPGVVSLVERADGDFDLRVVPPVDNRGDVVDVQLVLPPGCTRAEQRVHCDDGLAGVLEVRGMPGGAIKTLVTIDRDAGRAEWILDASSPRITIGQTPPAGAVPWIWLGVEHILAGPDHLAFVLGLLLVLGLSLDRRLVATITAFTLAHSCTLALAALGVVTLPTAPVEACIALSVLLVAREATHREPTAIRRWPWLVAGVFGLIHGLGFAAALAEIGLPRGSLVRSLVWFNVGVELGQLAVVAGVLALVAAGRRLVGERWVVGPHVHRAVAYGLGGLAAWWLIVRLIPLVGGAG